jgi:hypothetical protein
MIRSHIKSGFIKTIFIALLVLSAGVQQASSTVTGHYETDPTLCPDRDDQFPGIVCPFGQKICGVDPSNVPQCFIMSNFSAVPASGQTSITQHTASFGGGYVINCFVQPLDSAAPYCDNNGSWLCNRDSSCYNAPVNMYTTCTGAGTYSCATCRSGYQDCDANAGTCEVQTSVTNYPTGAHNNYGAACAPTCDTNYLDCDGEGEENTDGCEILNGGTCDSHAVYNGCSGGLGVCQCSSGYYDCNSDLGLGGNGCEVQTGTTCTTAQGVTGTYSACTCVPDKSYFETGTESVYSTQDPLVWGTQVGTGDLLNLSNAIGERFVIYNSGAIKVGTTTTQDAGVIRWNGNDFQGYDGTNWKSMTTGGGDGVNTAGDTMTGALKISNGAGLTTSGSILTDGNLYINRLNAAQDAILSFGNDAGAETLKFSDTTNRFEFSDDVNVQGDLTVTGTINGVSAANLASDNTHLKVGTGAGLEVTIAAGDYRINGTLIHYNGSSTFAVLANTTNYLYLTATGVLVTGAGFPTDKSIISLATVTTSGEAVTGIADRRAMSNDDREESRVVAFHPAFDGASYLGDGSDNIGRLYVTDATGVATNFYVWTSTRDSLQDYDVTLRATVPSSFLKWQDPALQVSYTSNTADSADNQLDISVYDTAGNLVTLSGSSLNLAATDWTTTNIEFNAGATWAEEQDFRIVFHLSAKGDHSISLGGVKLRLKTLMGG